MGGSKREIPSPGPPRPKDQVPLVVRLIDKPELAQLRKRATQEGNREHNAAWAAKSADRPYQLYICIVCLCVWCVRARTPRNGNTRDLVDALVLQARGHVRARTHAQRLLHQDVTQTQGRKMRVGGFSGTGLAIGQGRGLNRTNIAVINTHAQRIQ